MLSNYKLDKEKLTQFDTSESTKTPIKTPHVRALILYNEIGLWEPIWMEKSEKSLKRNYFYRYQKRALNLLIKKNCFSYAYL